MRTNPAVAFAVTAMLTGACAPAKPEPSPPEPTPTKDQEIESYRTRISAKDAEIAQLQRELLNEKMRRLQAERDKLGPWPPPPPAPALDDGRDGLVASRVTGGSIVFIDVGSRQGLKSGTRFEVFDYGRGTAPRHKGWIVIEEVQPTYARAAIIAERDRYDPIAKGDPIRNPLFTRERSPKFFLLGNPKKYGSRAELATAIVDAGGRVVDRVDPSVNFVVLGRLESESAIPFENRPEWERIQSFAIEIISPAYLAAFLRR